MKQPLRHSMRGHFCDHQFRVAEAHPVGADCQTVSLKGGATTTRSAQTQLRVIAIWPLVYHRFVANCTRFQCRSDNGSWLLRAVRLRGLASPWSQHCSSMQCRRCSEYWASLRERMRTLMARPHSRLFVGMPPKGGDADRAVCSTALHPKWAQGPAAWESHTSSQGEGLPADK